MRVHSNFAEYAPLALLLIYFVEVQGAPGWLVHALGLCLLTGRCVHAYGVSQVKEKFVYRVTGMVMTFTAMLVASAFLIVRHFVASGASPQRLRGLKRRAESTQSCNHQGRSQRQ